MPTEHTSQSEANKNKDKLNSSWDKDKKSTQFGDTNDPDYDPAYQNDGIDPGKPSNPNKPTQRNMNQDETKLHPVVATDDRLKASGQHVGGLPNQPIVTLHPTSKNVDTGSKTEYETISNVEDHVLDDSSFDAEKYQQFTDMDVGSGLLIPVEPNKTIDQTILEAQKQVHYLNEYYSVPEVNEEGEEVSDQVIVHEYKRNENKTVQLDGDSKPMTGANHQIRKRRIQLRQYAVKAVTENENISSDGALIIRVF